MKRFLLPLLPLVLILSSLEILVRTGVLPQFLCPAPSSVFQAIGEAPGEFLQGFLQTTFAAGLGLSLSILIGLGAALALTYSPWLRNIFYPYAIFFQTVPIIAIAPILVIWLGYGLPTVVASSFIVAVFPIIANSVMGLLSTPVEWVNLFQMMGAGRYQKLFQLRLPAALPAILGGVKISAGLSVIGAIVGEFISGTGLGGIVDAARNQQRVDRVFAAVGLAAVLGLMFFAVVSLSNAYLLLHREKTES